VPSVDPVRLRQVYGAFPTGVTALAALVDGRPVGLTASSFNSVSLDPPLVSVAVAHTSTTWPLIRSAPRFGVSVLSTEQEAASRQLSARSGDRFAGLRWHSTDGGAVVLDDASAWLDCSIHDVVRAGDHDLLLLRVHDLDAHPDRPPLVFHASQYRRLDRT
jgi:flavin reductase (DIM6/NTAB) family NADH-FMN oxidoreductase RutF